MLTSAYGQFHNTFQHQNCIKLEFGSMAILSMQLLPKICLMGLSHSLLYYHLLQKLPVIDEILEKELVRVNEVEGRFCANEAEKPLLMAVPA